MSEGQHNRLAAAASLGGAGDSLWQACVDQLAQELPEQQFNTLIKPLGAQVSDDFSRVTLFVANRFKLDWVRAQYAGRISAMLEKLYGQQVQLELAITPREASASRLGVRTQGWPRRERHSPRHWSAVMKRMFRGCANAVPPLAGARRRRK